MRWRMEPKAPSLLVVVLNILVDNFLPLRSGVEAKSIGSPPHLLDSSFEYTLRSTTSQGPKSLSRVSVTACKGCSQPQPWAGEAGNSPRPDRAALTADVLLKCPIRRTYPSQLPCIMREGKIGNFGRHSTGHIVFAAWEGGSMEPRIQKSS